MNSDKTVGKFISIVFSRVDADYDGNWTFSGQIVDEKWPLICLKHNFHRLAKPTWFNVSKCISIIVDEDEDEI